MSLFPDPIEVQADDDDRYDIEEREWEERIAERDYAILRVVRHGEEPIVWYAIELPTEEGTDIDDDTRHEKSRRYHIDVEWALCLVLPCLIEENEKESENAACEREIVVISEEES